MKTLYAYAVSYIQMSQILDIGHVKYLPGQIFWELEMLSRAWLCGTFKPYISEAGLNLKITEDITFDHSN